MQFLQILMQLGSLIFMRKVPFIKSPLKANKTLRVASACTERIAGYLYISTHIHMQEVEAVCQSQDGRQSQPKFCDVPFC